MPQGYNRFSGLKRPRILVRAARYAMAGYDRDRDICRVLDTDKAPAPAEALHRLLDAEVAMDALRREDVRQYSASHHIDLLMVLMSEIQAVTYPPELCVVHP